MREHTWRELQSMCRNTELLDNGRVGNLVWMSLESVIQGSNRECGMRRLLLKKCSDEAEHNSHGPQSHLPSRVITPSMALGSIDDTCLRQLTFRLERDLE